MGAEASRAKQIWLRSWWWDLSFLAFCWLPFYAWVVFGLGLGAEAWGLKPLSAQNAHGALALATTVALGTTYVHRHYTLLLVYGDRTVFAARAKHYVAAPLVMLAFIAAARWGKQQTLLEFGPFSISSWNLIVVIGTLWNIWHTMQQRYGILRAYGGRCQAGLQSPDHARRDFWLLWSLIGIITVLVLSLQRQTFALHRSTRFVDAQLGPFLDGSWFQLVLTLVCAGALAVTAVWLRYELRAPLTLSERLPRWLFLASTLALLAVFLWHGPIVGYLCFGVAHALEYLAFVHHFGEKKYAPGARRRGLMSVLFAKPLRSAPLLIGGFALVYLLVRSYQGNDLYVVYYIATSFLHFLYDGWIWKVRKPEVAAPLGIPARAG